MPEAIANIHMSASIGSPQARARQRRTGKPVGAEDLFAEIGCRLSVCQQHEDCRLLTPPKHWVLRINDDDTQELLDANGRRRVTFQPPEGYDPSAKSSHFYSSLPPIILFRTFYAIETQMANAAVEATTNRFIRGECRIVLIDGAGNLLRVLAARPMANTPYVEIICWVEKYKEILRQTWYNEVVDFAAYW